MVVLSLFGIIYAQQSNFYFDYKRGDKVEQLRGGQINWSKNYVIAKAENEISLIEQKDYSYSESIISETGEDVLESLFGIIRDIKLDDYRRIDYILKNNHDAGRDLSIMFKNSTRVLEPIYTTNTKFEVTAKIPIYGPNSISQALYGLYINNEDLLDKVDPNLSLKNNKFNKIIIDVRGLGFNPSIFPKIYYYEESADGKKEKVLFYGPELVNDEYREKSIYIQYFNDSFKYKDEIWVKYKSDYYSPTLMAYFTSALAVDGELGTDLIISKVDAYRFLCSRENIEMILEGNIFLLTE